VNVIIEIDTQDLLPHLRAELEAGGCSVEPISSHGCRVSNHKTADPEEAFFELCFFVRAWARTHGDVAVQLRPDF
jgi:hypothetical protein